jgi:hypothetical protein
MTASKQSAYSIPPFHKADTLDTVILRDDFITGGIATTLIGELGWTLADLGDGAPAVAHGAGEVNHPGFITVGSGATTPAADDGFILQTVDTDPFILGSGSVGIYVAAVVRFPTDLTAKVFRFGLRDDVAAAIPSSGVWLDFDQTVNAGVWAYGSTKATVGGLTASTTPVVAATWYKLEIVADNSEVQYFVDGVLIGSETTAANIPAVGLFPFFTGETDAGTTEEFYDIDAFMLRANVTR